MTDFLRPLFAALAFGAATLPAQSSARAFLPQKPMATFEMDGPIKLAQRFAGTRWADMFGSQEFAKIWEDAITGFDESMMEESGIRPEVKEAFLQLVEALGDYGGRMTFGVSFVPPRSDGRERSVTMTLSMRKDGGEALDRMLEVADELFGEMEMPIERATLGNGVEVDVMLSSSDPEGTILMPQMVGDYLVLGYGSSESTEWIEALAAEGDEVDAETDESSSGDAEGPSSTAPIEFEITGNLFQSIPKWASESRNERDVEIFAALSWIMDVFRGTQGLRCVIEPNGEFVESAYDLTWDDAGPNLGQLLAPEGRVPFLDLAPRTNLTSSTMSVRFDKLFDVVDDVAAEFGQSLDDLEDQAEEFLGLRLRADLFDLLDGDAMLTQLVDSEDPEIVTVGLVLGVKDAEALGKSVDGLIRKRGLHIARKKDDYRERTVSKLNLFGLVDMSWTIGDGLWVLGFGEEPGDMVRSIIDNVDSKKAGKEPAAWGERIQKQFARLGEDWQWCSVSDYSGEIESLVWIIEDELRGGVIEDVEIAGMVEVFVATMNLMIDYDIFKSVSSTSFEPGRMLVRTVN